MKRCAFCKKNKHTAEFHMDYLTTDGLRPYCKECSADLWKGIFKKKEKREVKPLESLIDKLKAEQKRQYEIPEIETKQSKKCRKCDTIRDLQDFHKNKSTKDGLSNHCKDCVRIAKYGMTVHVNACCKICGSMETLVIDHDHVTGETRGILCHRCNVGLSMFCDNSIALRRAANYLEGKI